MTRSVKKPPIKKILVFVLSVITVSLITLAVFLNLQFNKTLTVEVGIKSITVNDFISNKYIADMFLTGTDLSKVDLSNLGEYPVSLSAGKLSVKCTVNVVDTTPPAATIKENTIFKGMSVKPEDFVTDIIDMTDVTVKFKDEPDFTKPGKQNVTLILTDTSDNHSEIVSVLNIQEDSTPPIISGVEDRTVYIGQTISYRKNVTVTDDCDSAPSLTVDSKSVDVSKEGKYTVTYTATDSARNTSQKTATISVVRKPAANNESNENKSELAIEMADKVIASIIDDSMTTTQKVTAIYKWARNNISYSGSSTKSDYKVEAYSAFKNRSGDCYTYFAATKLMFERLNIPNIDVVKVKNHSADSNHYWSLVSVDGGSTYYHFDATPRKGSGDDFCLVTDAFIDAYSDAHNKSHNRDKSRYPATPDWELR